MASEAGGRERPGRLSFERAAIRLAAALAGPGLLAGLALLTRLPFRTRYLLNWDADQFALGVDHFDVAHHQPHPPGYLGYIVLGRLLEPLAGDANGALVALSLAGACAAAVLAYLFARELFGPSAGWVAGLALIASPLLWYYGGAANTYGLEPALALAVAWPAWRLWNGRREAALWTGLALGLAGALRPSTAFFLAPLVLAALWRARSSRAAAICLVPAALITLAWLLPLLVLAGGPLAYVQASLDLGGSVTQSTALWRAGLPGLATTGGAVLLGSLWELGAFAVFLVFGWLVAPRFAAGPRAPAGWAGFLLAWTLPALLTFLLVHIGQVAYVQVFTPALGLMLGPALPATCRALGRPGLAGALAALALTANTLIFLLPPRSSLAGSLELHDQAVAQEIALVSAYAPESTLLVTDAYAVGSYRTAQVYLPAYHRVALARDRSGRPGEVFGDVYLPDGVAHARPLSLPAGATTFIFLDRQTVDALVADPERMRAVRLADGSRVYVWQGAPPVLRHGQLWLGPDYHDARGRNL